MAPRSVAHLIVDRDGVLNVEAAAGWVTRPDQWVWVPGSLDALARCRELGVEVSVATNQSVIGRGMVSADEVDSLHRWVRADAARSGGRIGRILVCPHAPDAGCACRKPAPGLVTEAVRDAGLPPSRCIVVGDADRDLAAARAAGVRAVLVRTGKGRSAEADAAPGTEVFDDLAAAVRELLG